MANNLVVILDDGGGITVQCDGYVHNYDDVHEAARAVKAILDGADPAAEWDGNNPDDRIEWTSEDVWNGAYRVYGEGDLRTAMASDQDISVGWHNERNFLASLTGLR